MLGNAVPPAPDLQPINRLRGPEKRSSVLIVVHSLARVIADAIFAPLSLTVHWLRAPSGIIDLVSIGVWAAEATVHGGLTDLVSLCSDEHVLAGVVLACGPSLKVALAVDSLAASAGSANHLSVVVWAGRTSVLSLLGNSMRSASHVFSRCWVDTTLGVG